MVLVGSRSLGLLTLQGVAVLELARICQVNLFQSLLLDKDIPVADHGLVLSATHRAEAVAAARPGLVRCHMGDSMAVFTLTVETEGPLAAAAWTNGAVIAVLLCLFARLRYPVERGMATLKRWRIFRHARCSPNRLSSAAKAILTLERQR